MPQFLKKSFSRRAFLGAILCAGLFAPSFAQDAGAAETAIAKKPLVVYFSESGNTQKVAEEIHKLVGGDILRIEPVKPYPANYDELTSYAKKEQQANARPEIKTQVPDMSRYSMIFLGYPNWWSSMPMPVYTFLDKAKLSGMTIAPFDTHGGGGLGHSIADLEKLVPDCKVLKALSISGTAAGTETANKQIREWLSSMGLIAK